MIYMYIKYIFVIIVIVRVFLCFMPWSPGPACLRESSHQVIRIVYVYFISSLPASVFEGWTVTDMQSPPSRYS